MATGYTEITYGTIVLRDCLLRDFNQQPVYDQDQQTLLYDKYTVTVQGWFVSLGEGVASQTVQIDDSAAPTVVTSPGGRYRVLKEALSARRKGFQMIVGKGGPDPQTILYAEPSPDPVGVLDVDSVLTAHFDRAGGPFTRSIKIDEIVANETFKVAITFEVAIRPTCVAGTGWSLNQKIQPGYGVLSNRWQCADIVDEHRYTTRTYSGQITLSSPFISPHEFRFLALPPIQLGMVRKSIDFAAQSDGLKLRYTIRDEEVTITAPGLGTVDTDGTYMHVTQKDTIGQYSQYVLTNITIRLQGTPRSHRGELIRIAQVYADAKLQLYDTVLPLVFDDDSPKLVLIESYQMTEEFDTGKQNSVTLSIQIRRHPDEADGGALSMLKQKISTFGNTPTGAELLNATEVTVLKSFLADYDRFRSWGNRKWDYARAAEYDIDDETPFIEGGVSAAAALAAHLQNPCTTDFSIYAGMPGNETRMAQMRDSRTPYSEPSLSFSRVNTLPDYNNQMLSEQNRVYPYENYRIDSEYRKEEMVIPLPVAREADEFIFSSGEPPQATNSISNSNKQTEFVQLAPPQNQRVVKVEATRWGKYTRLPTPFTTFVDSDGVTHALIKDYTNVGAPELTGNQDVRIYRVEAEYVYAMSHSPKTHRPGLPDYESGNSDGVGQFIIPIANQYAKGDGLEYSVPVE
jgi:hypothetical protein